ncbi:uncharacterized protein LOC113228049 [Hyposmocoma kahamanoa]|uniref:uncharacterized protein LOC113227934 n=1 Tax=Hyposmocoma kahamanoa TaxID=1477025 RepID=UPI000E6D8AE9|nr:uncharacterized protein LOC113227934 [Hyposmocoma kahamanoa]XP_026316974.1 uncharacterized protein LOC113228049 [Hyposmocoma kahamanoa]
MTYIVLIESIAKDTASTSCEIKAQGLQQGELNSLRHAITSKQLVVNELTSEGNTSNIYEVDAQGVLLLNILSSYGLNYKVSSQSMVIEKTDIGGRTLQVQKTVWTLAME